jgi:hypothetical protein
MRDELYDVEVWLRRTWDVGAEIAELETRKEKILASMSGVAKYDAKAVKGGSDSNPTESKNLEYSSICEKIDKLQGFLSAENTKTLDAIYKISDDKKDAATIRTMLIAYSINRVGWKALGKKRNYEKTASYSHRDICLEAILPYVPDDAFRRNDTGYYSE